MTSPRPPRLRDTRSRDDRLRQDRQNLKQLGVGLLDGRFPPARLLGRPTLDGDEDDDDGTSVLFENTDTGVVSSNGAQVTITLSHEPIEGSEQVFYRGMGLKRTDWYRTESLLTIPAEHWFKAGDKCWVDYAYEDVEVDGPRPLTSFTLRGQNGGPANSSITLPPTTQIGDTMVVVVMNQRGWSATITDPRLRLVDSRPDVSWGVSTSAELWMGTATDLSAIGSSAPSSWPSVGVMTFAEPMTVRAQAETMGVGTSALTLPTVDAGSALLIMTLNNDTVTGPSPNTSASGYNYLGGTSGNGYMMWSVYDYLGDSPTPSGSTTTFSGSVDNGSWALVLGVTDS